MVYIPSVDEFREMCDQVENIDQLIELIKEKEKYYEDLGIDHIPDPEDQMKIP